MLLSTYLHVKHPVLVFGAYRLFGIRLSLDELWSCITGVGHLVAERTEKKTFPYRERAIEW